MRSFRTSFCAVIVSTIALLFLSASAESQQARKKKLSPRQIARVSFPSVVVLVTEDATGQAVALGSGFFVAANLVATNYHVIEGAARVYARRIDESGQLSVVAIVASDEANDLSLLRVSEARSRPLTLARREQVAIGDEVYVIGNPEGLEGTFSQGIVSAIRGRQYIQITAPISHGSSGGPVINSNGEVIGIAVGMFKDGQNLNFAVPVSYLLNLLNRTSQNFARSREPKPGKTANSPKAFFDRGDALRDRGDLQGALRAYERAVRLDRKYPDALYALARTYQDIGNNNLAIQYYQEAIRVRPDDKLAIVDLANLYEEIERVQDAITVYKKAINTNPAELYAYLYLAELYEKQLEYAEEVEVIKRASSLDSYKVADAIDRLRYIYLVLKESDIDDYKRAVRASPNNASYHMILGMTYLRIGDKESAIQESNAVQTLDRDMAFLFSQILQHCIGKRCTR